jgi:ribokinase
VAIGDRTGKITVVGSICQDLVVTVPHLPARGETVLSRSFETFVGGKGFNQALQAHRLGCEIAFFGKLGDDLFGDDAIRQLNAEGFPDPGVVRTGSATALGMIMVEDGGMNYIAGFSGANMEFSPDDIDIDALDLALSRSSHLVLQMEIPTETNRFAMEAARRHGCTVAMNFAPYRDTPADDIDLMDLLIFNEVEASGFYKTEIKNAADAMGLGCMYRGTMGNVVITLGAEGAVVFTPEHAVHLPGEKVNGVDSTGAGDSFVGALIYYLSMGDDPVNSAMKANHAAAISVTRMGAMPSLPRADEL